MVTMELFRAVVVCI